VAVDPAALARLQDDLVHAEARDAELPAQRREALAAVEVEAGRRGAGLHGRAA
jgi:hypothetical protein